MAGILSLRSSNSQEVGRVFRVVDKGDLSNSTLAMDGRDQDRVYKSMMYFIVIEIDSCRQREEFCCCFVAGQQSH